jgi:hypothetical protein
MNELMDNEQGGREYELYQEERAKEQWLDETGGNISFEDWQDGDFDPLEESEEDDED